MTQTTIAITPAAAPFDFAPLLAPGLPAPAIKWNGFPRYNFVGGHNDAEQVPVAGPDRGGNVGARARRPYACELWLGKRPAGLSAAARVFGRQTQGRRRHFLRGDEILITSGSLQGIELVNGILLSRGDTVLIEQVTYFGSLNRLVRLGVNPDRNSPRP